MQEFVFRSALRRNQISFSHGQDPTRTFVVATIPLSGASEGTMQPGRRRGCDDGISSRLWCGQRLAADDARAAGRRVCGNESKRTSSNLSGPIVMPKFANVVTIEVAPGRRDQVVTELTAHKARLKDEPGTLQFEVLLPQDDDTKIFAFEMYRDATAFEVHLNGPSLAQLRVEIAGMVMKLHGVRCAVLD